ncbi:MAG: hypothetical protein SGPRY_010707, partial [Prymnesium sp.]
MDGRSRIVNCSAAVDGGAIHATEADVTVADGSEIVSCVAGGYGGGILVAGRASVQLDSAHIRDSSSRIEGGGVALRDGGAIALRHGSSVVGCSSQRGGGVATQFGRLACEETSFVNCSAVLAGGGLFVLGGEVWLSRGVSLLHSSAGLSGGAVTMFGGHLKTDGLTISTSSSELRGGAIEVTGGNVELRASHISSSSSRNGGAIALSGGNMRIFWMSVIDDAFATLNGGAVWMLGGNLFMDTNSSILNPTALNDGGALYVIVGEAIIDHVHIRHAYAGARGGALYLSNPTAVVGLVFTTVERSVSGGIGGAIHLTNGQLQMDRVTIVGSHAYSGVGHIVSSQSTAPGAVPALLAISSSRLKQSSCNGSLLYSSGVAQFSLKSTTITPMPGCDTASLNSSAAFVGVSIKGCNDSIVAPSTQRTIKVCDVADPKLCSPSPIKGTPLVGVRCECSPIKLANTVGAGVAQPGAGGPGDPEFMGPDSTSPRLAPLQESCLQAFELDEIEVEANKVEVTLHKNHEKNRNVSVELSMTGNNVARLPSWEIINVSTLRARSPWLDFPIQSGDFDISGFDGVEIDVDVPIHLSSTSLREAAAPYVEIVSIMGTFPIRPHQVREVEVMLTVRARTETVVWGHIEWSDTVKEWCQPTPNETLPYNVSVREPVEIDFTACDVDSIPVDHQLPSQSDNRWIVVTLSSDTNQLAKSQSVGYVGGGRYQASLEAREWGTFTLRLMLGSVLVTALNGLAVCPADRVSLPQGQCGCGEGYFQPSSKVFQCLPCEQEGTSSAVGAIGISSCDVCKEQYYRPSASHPASDCTKCLEGAVCPWNSTLRTLQLKQGYWRLSDTSMSILKCDVDVDDDDDKLDERCEGGGMVYTCAPGHDGPLCQVCTLDDHYFDDSRGHCVGCNHEGRWHLLACLIPLVLVSLLFFHPRELVPDWLPRMKGWSRRLILGLRDASRTVGLLGKLKIMLSFYQ